MPLTSTKVIEIAAGTEGVTKGPWHQSRSHDQPLLAASFEIGSPSRGIAAKVYGLDAAHIANCDPDTIKELCRLALIGIEAERDGARERTIGEIADYIRRLRDDNKQEPMSFTDIADEIRKAFPAPPHAVDQGRSDK